jgi:hypothetical protein
MHAAMDSSVLKNDATIKSITWNLMVLFLLISGIVFAQP